MGDRTAFHRRVLGLALLVPGTSRADPIATTSFSCRSCHTRIFEEWAGSAHARSFDSPLFKRRYQERGRPRSCLQCHAPGSVFESGLGHRPEARRELHEEGVSCISCHRAGHAMVGPHSTPDAAHPTARDVSIRTVGMCASCHGGSCEELSAGAGQTHDYLHAPQRSRETCQSCHMAKVFASSVDLARPNYPAREGRSHRIEASRDPEVLRLAAELDAWLDGRGVTITVGNATSGHKLPGNPERALILETRFTDRGGLEFGHQIEYMHAVTRTRLRAGETRTYRYLLRPHYEAAEVRLLYRLFPDQPRPDWVEVDRVSLPLVPGRAPAGRPDMLPGYPAEPYPPQFVTPNLRTP